MSEDFGPNFVTLTDDEGNDVELEYVDALEYNGTTYMAFFPVVEEDSEEEENEEEYGLVILKSQMENGEEFLVTVDDEEEIDKVYDLFMEQILSDALPPLEPALIERLASSFDDLESIRENIIRLTGADKALSAFLTTYSGYAFGVLRDRGEAMRTAQQK